MHKIQANILLKNDVSWQLNKKAVEGRMRIKEKNQKVYQDLSTTLNKLELKHNYKMDIYKHSENEFKERHLNTLQKKILNIKSHLSNEELIKLMSRKENEEKKSHTESKSMYSRIVKKNNFEPHYEEDWEFIDNFLQVRKKTKQENLDFSLNEDVNSESRKNLNEIDLESNKAMTSSCVSLPSIASNYLEDDKFFFKSKKIDYQKIYLYKKIFYQRQSYEMKANEFSRTSFSCHKQILPKV